MTSLLLKDISVTHGIVYFPCPLFISVCTYTIHLAIKNHATFVHIYAGPTVERKVPFDAFPDVECILSTPKISGVYSPSKSIPPAQHGF